MDNTQDILYAGMLLVITEIQEIKKYGSMDIGKVPCVILRKMWMTAGNEYLIFQTKEYSHVYQ